MTPPAAGRLDERLREVDEASRRARAGYVTAPPKPEVTLIPEEEGALNMGEQKIRRMGVRP